MHELYSSIPRKELRNHVRAFAQRHVVSPDTEIVQTVPAFLEHVVEFEFGDLPSLDFGAETREQAYRISATGPSAYRPTKICFAGDVESFAIFFQPLAFSNLFRIQTSKMTNRFFNGRGILGADVDQLWCRMMKSASFDKRVELVEEWLLRRAANALSNTPIARAALYIAGNPAHFRMEAMASNSSMSVRQFERRFVKEIGITPKLYFRIARFQMVLDAKIRYPDRSWLSLSHKYGFFDQMHMIRDFQSLSGWSPELLLSKLGDARPPALVASHCGLSPIVECSAPSKSMFVRQAAAAASIRNLA
jgi:AraC-like DNA-binding protein